MKKNNLIPLWGFIEGKMNLKDLSNQISVVAGNVSCFRSYLFMTPSLHPSPLKIAGEYSKEEQQNVNLAFASTAEV